LNSMRTIYFTQATGLMFISAFQLALTVSAHSASFDCAKAVSKIEKAICADPELSNLDEYPGRYYAGALESAKGAAPSKAKTPFELTGELVWEQGDQMNMGYAVKPADGKARAFVLDMSIGNSPAHELVKYFIDRTPKPQYRVRGVKDDETGGFAAGECPFVYEMP
jgi:hypothetical protein